MNDAGTDSKLLLHPVRMRVVVAIAGGGPMTPRQLTARMPDVPPATLYRHLRVLAEAQVITVVSERRVRGTVERTYALETDRATITPQGLAATGPEERIRAFATFVATLLADYAAADRGSTAPGDLAYFVTPLELTDQQFAAFGAELQGVLQRAMAIPPSPTSRRRTLATILLPDPVQPGEPS